MFGFRMAHISRYSVSIKERGGGDGGGSHINHSPGGSSMNPLNAMHQLNAPQSWRGCRRYDEKIGLVRECVREIRSAGSVSLRTSR